MNTFTVPVPMLVNKGAGAALTVGVLGLLIMLVLASKSDPTARNHSI
jgi:hypothetical protein